jgi:small subunit ribosomal protein S13
VSVFKIEGELRSEVSLNIKRLMDIVIEVSVIELVSLGQRTKNNSRTRKGKRKLLRTRKATK